MPESGELIKNFLGEKYRCLCSRTPTLERNSVVKLDNRARDRELCILVVSTHYTVIPLHTNCSQNNHFRIVLDLLESKAIGQHRIVSLILNKNKKYKKKDFFGEFKYFNVVRIRNVLLEFYKCRPGLNKSTVKPQFLVSFDVDSIIVKSSMRSRLWQGRIEPLGKDNIV